MRTVICTKELGVTPSDAALIVREATRADSDIRLHCRGGVAPATNILPVLRLSITCGDMVKIVAEGTDAHQAAYEIARLGPFLPTGRRPCIGDAMRPQSFCW
jgi:phosphotransferase system HPr (HPr) family protein